MADAGVQPGRGDPRARFVDFEGLDWDEFPPLSEWTDDHWRDAIFDSPAIIPPGEPHADFRLARIDFRELALDSFPAIGDWSDADYDLAVQQTRSAREQRGAAVIERQYEDDPAELSALSLGQRLQLIDFELLLLDQLPPIGEWHEEHWWQAMISTYSAWMHRRIEDGEEEMVSLDEAFDGTLAPAD